VAASRRTYPPRTRSPSRRSSRVRSWCVAVVAAAAAAAAAGVGWLDSCAGPVLPVLFPPPLVCRCARRSAAWCTTACSLGSSRSATSCPWLSPPSSGAWLFTGRITQSLYPPPRLDEFPDVCPPPPLTYTPPPRCKKTQGRRQRRDTCERFCRNIHRAAPARCISAG
jgi:hypothetical protein